MDNKVKAPADMAWHIDTARKSDDAADYLMKARAAAVHISRVSPETQRWFCDRYNVRSGDLETDVQKFVDDAKAGVFQ